MLSGVEVWDQCRSLSFFTCTGIWSCKNMFGPSFSEEKLEGYNIQLCSHSLGQSTNVLVRCTQTFGQIVYLASCCVLESISNNLFLVGGHWIWKVGTPWRGHSFISGHKNTLYTHTVFVFRRKPANPAETRTGLVYLNQIPKFIFSCSAIFFLHYLW